MRDLRSAENPRPEDHRAGYLAWFTGSRIVKKWL
jgi:hypothetical protein